MRTIIVLCIMAISVLGVTSAFAATPSPSITRPQKVVIEIDPNDHGTATFHCHGHAVSGAGHNTFIFTHCEHGLH